MSGESWGRNRLWQQLISDIFRIFLWGFARCMYFTSKNEKSVYCQPQSRRKYYLFTWIQFELAWQNLKKKHIWFLFDSVWYFSEIPNCSFWRESTFILREEPDSRGCFILVKNFPLGKMIFEVFGTLFTFLVLLKKPCKSFPKLL